MAFRQLTDEQYGLATVAINAARTSEVTYPEFDGAELVAAGAALALERGAPRLIAQSYDIGADSYLKQGSQAWRALQSGIARFSDTDLNESEAISSRGDGVKMAVSEVLQKESARKVVMAAGNKDFESMLNPEQMELVKIARADIEFLHDLSSISTGSFDRLGEDTATSLKSALDAPIPGKLGQEVSLLSRAVDGIADREEALDEKMRMAEGNHRNFLPISDTYREQVQAFHREGVSTGVEAVDAAMTLLKQQDKIPENLHPNDPIMIAQARLLQESMVDVSQAPADLASMALSDAAVMTEARKEFLSSDMMPGIDSDIKGQGEYHLLEENDQARIDRDIIYGMKTPAIDKVRLEVAMLENSGIASMDRAHTMQTQEYIDPALADEVAKAADVIMRKYPDMEDYAFDQMGEMVGNHYHGRRNDRHLVEAAEELAQVMDDKLMSGSQEWEALSLSVDKALGRDQVEPLSRAAQVAAFEANAKANTVEMDQQQKVSRAQHMAALGNGMGM